MKVLRNKEFTPIQIVVETQEELDKLFAVFNNSKIADVLEISCAKSSNPWWEKLEKYKTDRATEWHEKLEELVR